MGSWGFVFGLQREQTVRRLLARLNAYLGPLVQTAVASSFNEWRQLATTPERRTAPAVLRCLYEQGLLWRDLVRGERDPLQLAPPAAGDPWKKVSVYTKAAEALKAPLITAGISTLLLLVSATVIANGGKYTWLATPITILGALGVTSAGLYARAKAQLTSLLDELQLKVDEQRVRSAASCCPPAEPPQPAIL
jgi:hypothetical protein